MTTAIARLAAALPRFSFAGVLVRLIEADRSWRHTRKLRSLSDAHLEDMNFYRQFDEIRHR